MSYDTRHSHSHHHHHRHHRHRSDKVRKLFSFLLGAAGVLFAVFVVFAVFSPATLHLVTDQLNLFVSEPRNRHLTLDYDGIDVSHHQGDIDWDKVAADTRVRFVYIKATEGYTYLDSLYLINIDEARRAGVKVGSYHYLTSSSPVTLQFRSFSYFAAKEKQDLIPMVDVEQEGVRGWTHRQLRDSLSRFAALVKAHYGKAPLIYSYAKFYNSHLAPHFNEYQLFLARYSPESPVVRGAGRHNIWQHTDQGTVDGISTAVDLDVFAEGTTLKDLILK